MSAEIADFQKMETTLANTFLMQNNAFNNIIDRLDKIGNAPVMDFEMPEIIVNAGGTDANLEMDTSGLDEMGQAAENTNSTFEGFKKNIQGFAKSLVLSLGPLGVFLQVLQSLGVFEPVMTIFQAFVDLLGMAFLPVTLALVDIFIPFIPIIAELSLAFQPLIQFAVDLIMRFSGINVILPLVAKGLSLLTQGFNILAPHLEKITNFLDGLSWDSVANFFKDLGSKAVEFLESGISAVWNWIEGLWSKLITVLGDLWDKIIEWIQNNLQFWEGWF